MIAPNLSESPCRAYEQLENTDQVPLVSLAPSRDRGSRFLTSTGGRQFTGDPASPYCLECAHIRRLPRMYIGP